ncbi:MAG: cell surface protein [Fibrobacteres bacterium]|nr:cell surface protein [Fibrobacterota bacterium]
MNLKNGISMTLALSAALPACLFAQQVLTTVTTATFAWVEGNKAVYIDYPGSKTAIIEIDLDTKVKRTLLPEAGSTPYYIDFGYDGENLAYVPFTVKPQYPLEWLDVKTGAKKILDADAGWKESVWVGGGKVVWVDYRHKTASDKNGEIYMYDLAAGVGKRITNNVGYQAKPVTDGKHIAFLDYSAGAKAAVTLYDIAAGTSIVPSVTDAHQDNPRLDGDWLVWEDYRNAKTDTANADIYAYDIKTKETKVLCNKPGYQGKPFLQGTAVVWADYRNDNGDGSKVDIFGYDLAENAEHQVATRAGYDDSPVSDGKRIVWFGTEGSAMNLYVGDLAFGGAPVRIGERPSTVPRTSAPKYRVNGRLSVPAGGKALESAASSVRGFPGLVERP